MHHPPPSWQPLSPAVFNATPRPDPLFLPCSKGQATNEVLFGGVSLGDQQRQALDKIKQTADRGLDVEL